MRLALGMGCLCASQSDKGILDCVRRLGDLHDHRHAAQQHNFMVPVELVGFSRSKTQRDIGCSRRLPMLIGPSPGITAHGIVTAIIAAPA